MNERYLTVSALTKYIKKKMEIDPHLQEVLLKGEISNFNHHSRGHMYLTIKDNHSRIQAVMFAGNNRRLKFIPENGMNVLVKGEVTVFEPHGQYQLYIREMEPDGIGALYLAYEQLKEKLSKKGYFDEHHKKEITKYPTSIGLITSPTGAAVKDMITTIKRRLPIVQITVIPAIVQGDEAPQSIESAIQYANTLNQFDTLIVGRGGGSIEDLWGFNDERVVKAIFHSNIPVISAVGHETDVTLSDFVADLRAPTPTGAAELAVPSLGEVKENIMHLNIHLKQLLKLNIAKKTEAIQQLRKSYAFHLPKHLINEKEQYVDTLTDKLTNQFSNRLQQKSNRFEQICSRLKYKHPEKMLHEAVTSVTTLKKEHQKRALFILQDKTNQYKSLVDKLTLLNPLHILQRGYALPYDEQGKLLKSTTEVKEDDLIQVRLADGSLSCQVHEVRRDENVKG